MPCSICKQPGHNKRSCPHANVTMRKTTTAKLKSMAKTFVSDDKDCCVCMSPIKSTNCCTTKCGHNFCLSCFFECVKHKPECPICRTKFNYSISGQVDKLKREYAELAEWTDELAYYDSRNCKKIRALEKTNAELEKTNAELYQKIKWYNMQLGHKHKIEKIVNDFQSTYKKLKQEIYST